MKLTEQQQWRRWDVICGLLRLERDRHRRVIKALEAAGDGGWANWQSWPEVEKEIAWRRTQLKLVAFKLRSAQSR